MSVMVSAMWPAIAAAMTCALAAVPSAQDEIQGTSVTAETLLRRAELFPGPGADRAEHLIDRFLELGAAPEQITKVPIPAASEQELRRLRQRLLKELEEKEIGPVDRETIVRHQERRLEEPGHNVVVRVPGASSRLLVVGAPLDVEEGCTGVIDNWSGLAMLLSLFEAFRDARLEHELLLVGFGAEELGCLGSQAFVNGLDEEEAERLDGMICLDGIGMTRPYVWMDGSSLGMAMLARAVAEELSFELQAVEFVDLKGKQGDTIAFRRGNMQALYVSGVDLSRGQLLHTQQETIELVEGDALNVTFAWLVEMVRALDELTEEVSPGFATERARRSNRTVRIQPIQYRLLAAGGPERVEAAERGSESGGMQEEAPRLEEKGAAVLMDRGALKVQAQRRAETKAEEKREERRGPDRPDRSRGRKEGQATPPARDRESGDDGGND